MPKGPIQKVRDPRSRPSHQASGVAFREDLASQIYKMKKKNGNPSFGHAGVSIYCTWVRTRGEVSKKKEDPGSRGRVACHCTRTAVVKGNAKKKRA